MIINIKLANAFAMLIVIVIFFFTAELMSQTTTMGMYKSSAIDGCEDFHCRKCEDRNSCTLGFNCGMDNCGHKHGAVSCDESIVFYLRTSNGYTDENGNKSCTVRAKVVAERLNSFMTMNEDNEFKFKILDENGESLSGSKSNPTIWFSYENGENKKLITVTNSDMQGYKYRASLPLLSKMATPPDEITKELVAQWWLANLTDHFRMMVLNKKPYLTTNTHCGKVLLTVWNDARALVPAGKISMDVFKKVMRDLSSEDKKHLLLAAQIIPNNFKW